MLSIQDCLSEHDELLSVRHRKELDGDKVSDDDCTHDNNITFRQHGHVDITSIQKFPIRPAPASEWREITERVWIAGTCREICHPPVWGWSFDHCGRRVWTIIRAGWTERIEEPGHWECRTRQVWVAYPTCGSGESWHGGGRGWHR